jgi:peptidoglycan/LPS O-acetylase OafA/YrhL
MSQHVRHGTGNLRPPPVQVKTASEEAQKSYHKRFLALDGLRGVAVLLVILAHGSQNHLLPKTFTFSGGMLGVAIFFVLSGFLITHLLLEEQAKTGRVSIAKFYARRALRIWPLYFAALGAYFFILPLIDQGNFGSIYSRAGRPDSGSYYHLLGYAFFLQNYLFAVRDMHLGLGVLWSLAVEEHFYVFWPLLLVALRGRWLVSSLVCVAIATFGLRILTVFGMLPKYTSVWHMTHTALDGLAAGCIIGCLYHSRPGVLKALSRHRSLYLLGWGLLLFLGWTELRHMSLSPTLPAGEYYKIVLGTLAAAVIVSYLVGRADSSRLVLCSQPLTYVGKVSYGIYVLHPIVLVYVAASAAHFGLLHGAGYFLAITVYLAVAVGVAGLSFKFFEAPILRFKKRFARV